jgi:hypothetical protein
VPASANLGEDQTGTKVLPDTVTDADTVLAAARFST